MRAPDLPPYRPPVWLRSGHLQTVLPTLFRSVRGVAYERERITTPDGDFLDLDWADATPIPGGAKGAVVVSHGLEGSSDRAYVRGMVRALTQGGWDAVAWNFRGCSGEPNRAFRSYHSGATDDLDVVVKHVLKQGYDVVGVVGFSLGGNITLKYLGDGGASVDERVAGGVAFSVPCDLTSSSVQLAQPQNAIYMRRFLRSLTEKAQDKRERYPGRLPETSLSRMRTFREFDGYYTAPAHGYASAEDYWRRASSKPRLPYIRRPTLLVSALDDPFLTPACYPYAEAGDNPYLHLITPSWGGHVGFMASGGLYWSERIAVQFFETLLDQERRPEGARG